MVDDSTHTVKVLKSVLQDKIFGEGVCPINETELMWLTWRDGKVLVLDAETLTVKEDRTFDLWGCAQEGWGVTLDKVNRKIYLSDGTSSLHKIDQASLEMEDCIQVTDQAGNPVENLNELEYVNGFIWANIFLQDIIVKIDAETGKIVKAVDMSSLVDA